MNKYKFLFILLLSFPLVAQEKSEIILRTDISQATVFINGAQIVRNKTVDLFAGKSTIKFINLSPYIDAKSVQLKVTGEVMVLSVNHQLNYIDSMKQSGDLRKIGLQLDVLKEKIITENTNLEIISEQLNFLHENIKIGGSSQGINLLNLKETAVYYQDKISMLKIKEKETKKTIDNLNKEKDALEKQERLLGNVKPTPTGEVLVKVDSKTSVKCDIELSYYVANAGWYPSYDIRAISIEEPIQLVYKANVHQNTKEDWTNVKLKVSSANPNVGNVAPKLQTYLLNYYTNPPKYDSSESPNKVLGRILDEKTKDPIIGANIMIKGSTIGTISDMNGNFELQIPNNSSSLAITYIVSERKPSN